MLSELTLSISLTYFPMIFRPDTAAALLVVMITRLLLE